MQSSLCRLIGAVGLSLALLATTAVAQPRADYCAFPGRPASLILIDRTSPYGTSGEGDQGARIAAGVDAILLSLEGGDRLTIATIERHRRLSEVAFDGCFPGCQRRRGGWPGGCPQATVDLNRNQFRRALFAAVVPLLENDMDQPNSDVAGTIFQTAATRPYNSIYIYSDMLENSEALPWSRFSSRAPAENFDAIRRNGFVPVLTGATVQIVGFGLSHSPSHPALTDRQDHDIREFWRLYFGAARATVSYRSVITP